ncbi:M1 family metallopeptidase [Pedobacter cryophilus]|uniref:Aminopeptidase N n=1 Tax=Pedobacter cryophilus TaxID=2571271 RepID=A0A4U1C5N4_9SPHI|nr:M1 family metallopeptidase [Pedobacter cryophilus]TKC00605.1 M1 family metallopeptidase [Pedobacter cryophilus]
MKKIKKGVCCLIGAAFFLSGCAKIHFIEFEPIFVRANAVGSNVYQGSKEKTIDIINTQLDISFSWDSAFVYGNATIAAKAYFMPQNKVILDAKGFKINKIGLLNNSVFKELEFSYQQNKLTIFLDKTYSAQEEFKIFISYTAMPEKLKVGKDITTIDDRGLYFINKNKPNKQIWTQGETDCNSGWFPTIEDPAEKMTQQFNITIEKNLKTLSNGILIASKENSDGTRTDSWEMQKLHSVYLAMIAVGDFKITEDSYRDIRLNYYTEPEFAPHAKAVFGHTPEMISFFSDTLNYPFPWPKYDQIVVKNFVSGAMENTTATVFYDQLNKTAGEIADESQDPIIAHELFHHWFGDLVTAESWSNLSLNESFATYAEYLWLAHKFGNAYADEHLMQDAEAYFKYVKIKDPDLIRFDYADKDQMFDAITYQKGGLILHQLRKEVGDAAFFTSLNLYLKTHEFKTAEIHDLRLAFEEVTGRDLNWFFNQWFLANSNPQIKISKVYYPEENALKIMVDQIIDTTHQKIYQLPFKVKIVNANQEQVFSVLLNQAHQEFSFPMDTKPVYVKFDADNQLLVEKQELKTEEDYALQYQYADDFIDRYESLNYFNKHQNSKFTKELMLKALDDESATLMVMALNYIKKLEVKEQELLATKLMILALKASESKVRAASLMVLAKIKSAKTKKEIGQQLKTDPSLLVQKALKQGKFN